MANGEGEVVFPEGALRPRTHAVRQYDSAIERQYKEGGFSRRGFASEDMRHSTAASRANHTRERPLRGKPPFLSAKTERALYVSVPRGGNHFSFSLK
ncbi:MAG: hypothetical protein DRI36_04535 [Caldiserica bacterium]|nr:MAG: hypothetical protein DRI36_04535 [Caldisericota bacterium]